MTVRLVVADNEEEMLHVYDLLKFSVYETWYMGDNGLCTRTRAKRV